MRSRFFHKLLAVLLISCCLGGCNLPAYNLSPTPTPSGLSGLPIAAPLPALPETLITFRVQAPASADDTIYLSILDEVTGLALNAQNLPMQTLGSDIPITTSQTTQTYLLTMPAAIGSVITYRYEKQTGDIRVGEHLADGSAVRYRLYHVDGPGTIDDVVSRWTDTKFKGFPGRIVGQVSDAATGMPIPNLLITAGGAQTITKSDGSFLLESLPEGVHNLVAFALDGSYQTYQQGALVAAESTTPAPLKLNASPYVKVVFVVKAPADTPPVVPLRMAGNLFPLGNSFATLTGGLSTLAANMPVLSQLPDGRYTLTLSLPVGADIHYKYSLGDGFWNAEHSADGAFRLRQIVVPDHNVLVEDVIDSWYIGSPKSIVFDLTVPPNTPPQDTISIQFGPLFGWTEPVPMWSLGNNRWVYVLYSPLNLPGNFNYRYCRNDQCGYADDALTPGLYGQGRPVKLSEAPLTINDQVPEWANFLPTSFPVTATAVAGRNTVYWAGVELAPAFHPSWLGQMAPAMKNIQQMGANWVVLSPTWTFGRYAPGNTPPLLDVLPGQDMMWSDVNKAVAASQSQGLNVALFPTPRFLQDPQEWWQTASRDQSWWVVWFEQYRLFLLHHADLAARANASALILGGDWLAPALPGGLLADGSASGLPEDADSRWRGILAEVRARFAGSLLWALPQAAVSSPPGFLDLVDQVYVLWEPAANWQEQCLDLETDTMLWMDATLYTFQVTINKPVILAAAVPATPDLQAQFSAYETVLRLVNGRDWIGGMVTRGYYPPAALTDSTPSVHGKPAGDLIQYWFLSIFGKPLP
ncbi:MAG: hypothetical protein JXB15_03410 [Anaerolineales bacterium]|nr:hypothetical protein [Anaerolineales bacterium]